MADLVKLPGIKANDRVTSLKASSDTLSRFHLYCASSSRFPTPPPAPALTAIERLKKFKAICKKQQYFPSKGTSGGLVARKPLPRTLVLKKGLRKSSALTPGKSPGVKCSRKKIGSRKSIKRKSRVLELKEMAKVESAVCEMYGNLNSIDTDHSVEEENICDLKKKALKKVFSSDERNSEQDSRAFENEPFHEYTNQNGSNDSEEIDVVNGSKNEVMDSNGHSLNGDHNGVGDEHFNSIHGPKDHGSDSDKSITNENRQVNKCPETFKEFNNDILKVNQSSENGSVEIIFKNSDSYATENKSEVSEAIISEECSKNNGNSLESDDEDFTFGCISPDPAEPEVSPASKKSVKSSAENFSVSVPIEVTGDEIKESEEEQSQSVIAVEVESQNEKSVSEIMNVESGSGFSDASVLILNDSCARKKSKAGKSTPRKKSVSPKKTASPIKKSPRKKKLPVVALDESKFEDESLKHSTVFTVSSASETESINKTVDLVSSDSNISYLTNTDPKKPSKVTPGKVSEINDGESSKTSPRPRRSKRSYSLTRRAPLRSSERLAKERSSADRSMFESTPQYNTKRKAEILGEVDVVKRLKNEAPITGWNFLSSPIKNYWSPKLSNCISYKQPDSTLSPDQLPSFDSSKLETEETPVEETQNTSQNSTEKSRSWCTIS